MPNQPCDTQPAVISWSQLTRLQKDITSMNPVGVRTTYSNLPTQDVDVSIGIYDTDLGSGVIVELTNTGALDIHLVYCRDNWKPKLDTPENNVHITPNMVGGYTVDSNEFNPNSECTDMGAYELLTFLCQQWTLRLGWLQDIRARLFPTAPKLEDTTAPLTDNDICDMYWQIQPHLKLPADVKDTALNLFIQQIQQYSNLPSVNVNGSELRIDLTPEDGDAHLDERGVYVIHKPDNIDVPIIIETFNSEEDAIDPHQLLHVKGDSLHQLHSLDYLIEYMVANTPTDYSLPPMLDDFLKLKSTAVGAGQKQQVTEYQDLLTKLSTGAVSVDWTDLSDEMKDTLGGFRRDETLTIEESYIGLLTKHEERFQNVRKYKESLHVTSNHILFSNVDSPLCESLVICTAFHGRLTRLILNYRQDGEMVRTNISMYAAKPLTGPEMVQLILDQCYTSETIAGNVIQGIVTWLRTIEVDLERMFR